MMELRVATWADVESVLDRLSEANRAEYAAIGFPGETFNLRLMHFLLSGEAHCLWFDGKPQAFIGIAPQNGFVTTWLGVTEECLHRGAGPIKAARRHLRETADRFGPITSFLTSTHPRIVKWMALMGFDLIEEKPGVKVFRYA